MFTCSPNEFWISRNCFCTAAATSTAPEHYTLPVAIISRCAIHFYLWNLFDEEHTLSIQRLCRDDLDKNLKHLFGHAFDDLIHFAVIHHSHHSMNYTHTWPMSCGWLRNSTDPDEFRGLLMSRRRMPPPRLSFLLSLSVESLILTRYSTHYTRGRRAATSSNFRTQ